MISDDFIFGRSGRGLLLGDRIAFGGARSLADPTFITEWQTTTAAESITLPLISTGTYDFEVDWGDGSTDTITAFDDAARIHEYAEAGVRDVRISGVCEHWNFNSVTTSRNAILDVKNWGTLKLGSAAPSAFARCVNLDLSASDALDFTGVSDAEFLFRSCSLEILGTGISLWDVSSVTGFYASFYQSDFNGDISGWDVSSVTNMQSFLRDIPFNQDISGWDVSNVENMFYMLEGAAGFNQNLGPWSLRRAGVDMGFALSGTALSPENYSRTLIGWANYVASSPGGPYDVPLGAGTLTYNATEYEPGETYTNAVDARAYLTTATLDGGAGWTITDGGLAP